MRKEKKRCKNEEYDGKIRKVKKGKLRCVKMRNMAGKYEKSKERKVMNKHRREVRTWRVHKGRKTR